LTNAEHRDEAARLRRDELARDERVGLAVDMTPLRVTDDHVAAADVTQHRSGYFTGEGTLRFRAYRLRAELHVAVPEQASRLPQVRERRAHEHFDAALGTQQVEQRPDQVRVLDTRT